MTRGVAIAIAVLVALGASVYLFARSHDKGGGPGASDTQATCQAAAELRADLVSRRAKDGAFAFLATLPSEPWTTGQVATALSVHGAPEDKEIVASCVEFIRKAALRRDGKLVGWVHQPGDTLAGGEPTAYAIAALAAARARYSLVPDAEARELVAFLTAAQNPDGSFSPTFMATAAGRSSSTQDALLALLLLDAPQPSPSPDVAAAVERCAAWIGTELDPETHRWRPKVRASGPEDVAGLSDLHAWLLLEAQEYLPKGLPKPAADALHVYAAAFRSVDLPLDALGAVEVGEYAFEPPAGESSIRLSGHRWSWYGWRVLAATRFGAWAANPRRADWEREAARLREELPRLAPMLKKSFGFHVAESLVMAAILCRTEPGSPAYGSMVAMLRGRPR